jgi:hypothetical protein
MDEREAETSMPSELPYLPSYKNLPTLFDKIASAKRPDTLTQKVLRDTFGLKSTGDRSFIPFLRTLGFIDSSSRPTVEYALLKNSKTRGPAIAEAVRRAYAPLFEADESAHTLTGDALKGLIAQVGGTDDSMTQRIAYTFAAIAKLGDFNAARSTPEDGEGGGDGTQEKPIAPAAATSAAPASRGLRPDFHYNIQVHLPSNGSEETYLNIFNAIRKVFR